MENNTTTYDKSALDAAEKRKDLLIKVLPFAVLVLLFAGLSIATGGKFLKVKNLFVMINTVFPLIIASLGAMFVYGHGGMDLSVGSMQGIVLVEVLLIFNMGLEYWYLAVLAAVATGLVCGFLNGFIISMFRIPPLIVTICMQYVLRGIVTAVAEMEPIYAPSGLDLLDNVFFKFAVIIVLVIAAYLIFEKTRFGKYQKAIGGNEAASAQAGIRVMKYKILAYMLVGLFVAISTLIAAPRMNVARANAGAGFEMDVMVAILVGGMPLSGGAKTNIRSAIIGALILVVMENGLLLCGLQPEVIDAIKGCLFLVAVYLTYERNKGEIMT